MTEDLLNYRSTLLFTFQVRLGDQDILQVEAGDLVGFVNSQSTSVIGHNFQPVRLLHAPPSGDLKVGSTVTFDTVYIPYSFALAASFTLGKIYIKINQFE